ncbi:MAG: peptide-methionine (S)-S-oxide reductase MsrA, partial [Sedimentisphaerales bacterium]|nr:peptide-methionine (S)-S-oxide reductase MsrA [Sedimentisphaerales bacterium]
DNPTYKDVCADITGHAEVVQVTFDPDKVSYGQLLDTFWKIHNPTSYHRQGPDVGSQYRSAIFCYGDKQLRAALDSKAALEKSGKFEDSIKTEIKPAATFYPAEDYHQRYYQKHKGYVCPTPEN